MASEATIQLIQLRELLRLSMALPSRDEQLKVASVIDNQARIQNEIDTQ